MLLLKGPGKLGSIWETWGGEDGGAKAQSSGRRGLAWKNQQRLAARILPRSKGWDPEVFSSKFVTLESTTPNVSHHHPLI